MSAPEFPKPDPDLTQEKALTMILSSIALEEAALGNIVNAESEKIQYLLNQCNCGESPADVDDLLAINRSVACLLEMVMQNQLILKNKMERVLEFLPDPPRPPRPDCLPACLPWPICPPGPVCPSKPVCPPGPVCPPVTPCTSVGLCSFGHSTCFVMVPKAYRCNEPLQWMGNQAWGRFELAPGNRSKIRMPRTGTYEVELHMSLDNSGCSSSEVKLILCCEGRTPIVKRLSPAAGWHPGEFCGKTVIQMPSSSCPCYASVIACAPNGMHVRQGRIVFRKA